MTPDLIPIYGSSLVAVAMLALFATHNRKTGWKRQRGPVAQWLSGVYHAAYGDETVADTPRAEPEIPSWVPLTPTEAIGFSAQLLSLQGSLGAAGNAPQPVDQHARAMTHK